MSKCTNCPHGGTRIFCNMGEDSRKYLETNSIAMEYPRASVLFHEGDTCSAVFVLCSGRIKVSTTSREGKKLILRIAEPGDVLGMSAAFFGQDYEVTAESLEPCKVRVLHVKYFAELMRRFGDASVAAAKALASEYRATFDEVRLIALPSSPAGRVARLILDWAERARQKDPKGLIRMTLTHDEVASMTGTTRETVTRTLGKFGREKLIAIRGTAWTVLEPKALEDLSAC